jgi:hypothetical protein
MSAVAIAGVGVYAAGFANAQAFRSGIRATDAAAPSGALLDKHSRRRASLLTKAFADTYQEALQEAALDPTQVGSVFGSALGEAATMIGLLDQMWKQGGALSPMRFAASVHNAASGVVSISTKNTGLTTSLGADFDTPAMALCEGIGIALCHDSAVIVVCGDESAPADLVTEDQGWECLVCALALVPLAHADPRLPRIGMPHRQLTAASLAGADLQASLAQNPQAGLLDLIAALTRSHNGSVRLDRGRGRGYCVEIATPA